MAFVAVSRLAAPVLMIIYVLFAATAASAHAVLLSVTPADNAILEQAPDAVVLGFNEPVSLLAASLIAPDGQQSDVMDGARNGSDLSIALPSGLGQGTHVLSWRVVSVDGHPVGGVAVFSIGMRTGSAATQASSGLAVSGLLWASKSALYIALFFGLGMAVFNGLVGPLPDASRRLAGALLCLGLLAAPFSLGLQGLDALGLGLGDIASLRAWTVGLSTSYGWTALLCMGALGLAWASVRGARGPRAAGLAIAAWIAVPLALALSGHASAASPQWLMRPAVFLHVAAILFWTGALVPLVALLAQPAGQAFGPLVRFSAIIPLSVAVLVVSGLVLTTVQLGPDPAHWVSPYGAILLGKLGILVIIFSLALWNRLVLTRPAGAGEARAQRRLKMSIGAEIVLIIVLVCLVAVWRFTPPPRALAEAAAVPVAVHMHSDRAMADLTIAPGRIGANQVTIFVSDAAFGALEPLAVAASVMAPDLGIEAMRVDAVLGEDGVWRADDLLIPLAGSWQLDLEIRLSRFELVRLSQTFAFPADAQPEPNP